MNTLLKSLQNGLGRIGRYQMTCARLQKLFSAAAKRCNGIKSQFNTPLFVLLANHGLKDGLIIAVSNSFTVLQDDWIQLSPYGDFPHQLGLQRMDKTAAEGMVTQFNSFLAKAGRIFGGLPWYIGHHDVDPVRYPDGSAYGWIMKLEAREDGLYGNVKWTEKGEALKTDGSYKYFSPCWNAVQVGKQGSSLILKPTQLVSVGFTNMPNIPVAPLVNEAQTSIPNSMKPLPYKEFILANYGTSEGAKKGWETRRGSMSADAKSSRATTAKALAQKQKDALTSAKTATEIEKVTGKAQKTASIHKQIQAEATTKGISHKDAANNVLFEAKYRQSLKDHAAKEAAFAASPQGKAYAKGQELIKIRSKQGEDAFHDAVDKMGDEGHKAYVRALKIPLPKGTNSGIFSRYRAAVIHHVTRKFL